MAGADGEDDWDEVVFRWTEITPLFVGYSVAMERLMETIGDEVEVEFETVSLVVVGGDSAGA